MEVGLSGKNSVRVSRGRFEEESDIEVLRKAEEGDTPPGRASLQRPQSSEFIDETTLDTLRNWDGVSWLGRSRKDTGSSRSQESQQIFPKDLQVRDYGSGDATRGGRAKSQRQQASCCKINKHGTFGNLCFEITGCLGLAVILAISVYVAFIFYSSSTEHTANVIVPDNATTPNL